MAGLTPNAIQYLTPAVLKEEEVVESGAPAARLRLSGKAKTVFATHSNAPQGICHVYDTDFQEVTGSHGMETGDSLSKNKNHAATYAL